MLLRERRTLRPLLRMTLPLQQQTGQLMGRLLCRRPLLKALLMLMLTGLPEVPRTLLPLARATGPILCRLTTVGKGGYFPSGESTNWSNARWFSGGFFDWLMGKVWRVPKTLLTACSRVWPGWRPMSASFHLLHNFLCCFALLDPLNSKCHHWTSHKHLLPEARRFCK